VGNPKSFDIKNLLPFHKVLRGVPRSVHGEEEKIAALDPKLSAEEQAFVRHYLAYADILLKGPPDELDSDAATEEEIFGEKVIEMDGNKNQDQLGSEAAPKAGKEEGDTEAA
jgi:hypothetical protein